MAMETQKITPVPVVMRSHNDLPLIRETLEMVSKQTYPYKLFIFDNASDDGTLEVVSSYTDAIFTVPKGKYVPGEVLNRAMEAAGGLGEFVVFLNSDCTPANEFWLEKLLTGFTDESVCAVFGRQSPRPDCKPLFAKDTNDTYGDGARQALWKHCFSMASSAIRTSCWEESAFREDIQYSEDIDWTWRARQRGWTIQYVKDSEVYHSHNYTYAQFKKRHYGEGKAEAAIFTWSSWEKNFFRYSFLPYARQVKDDMLYALSHKKFGSFFYSPVIRFAQLTGRRKGFKEGLRAAAAKE